LMGLNLSRFAGEVDGRSAEGEGDRVGRQHACLIGPQSQRQADYGR
jgi:hypothetical protein